MVSPLGAVIREARARSGLTQAELAKRVRMTTSAIARYESGRIRPRFETARRSVEACGFELRMEVAPPSSQRRAAADAALGRSVEDRLRTNDSFTQLATRLRHGRP